MRCSAAPQRSQHAAFRSEPSICCLPPLGLSAPNLLPAQPPQSKWDDLSEAQSTSYFLSVHPVTQTPMLRTLRDQREPPEPSWYSRLDGTHDSSLEVVGHLEAIVQFLLSGLNNDGASWLFSITLPPSDSLQLQLQQGGATVGSSGVGGAQRS